MVILGRSLLAIVALAFAVLLSLWPQHEEGVFFPEVFRLENGMQLVVVQNKLSAAVAHMVWYRVGAADEPEGKTGLAHYLEHMMFKGTKKYPEGAFHKEIERIGGQENAATSYDYTNYYELVATEHLGKIMAMETDRMRGLTFTNEQAVREKSVVLSERQQRIDNGPHGLFVEQFRKKLFPNHPYGRPIAGVIKDIESLTINDLQSFYKAQYQPTDVTVVVSGNVEPQKVLRLAKETYGKVERTRFMIDANLFIASEKPIKDSFVYKDPRVMQPMGTRQFVLAHYNNDPRLTYALEVLAEVLNGEVGLLHRYFVVDKKKAVSVSASYDWMMRIGSHFALSMAAVPDGDLQALEKDVMQFLKQLADKGITEQNIQEAKKRLVDDAVFARDNVMVPAQILGRALTAGLPLDAVEAWPSHIGSVSVNEVNQALRTLLDAPHQMAGFLLQGKREIVQ